MIRKYSNPSIDGNQKGLYYAGLLKMGIIILIFLISVCLPVHAQYEINDGPMTAQVSAAPPLIMFVLDDSGSMDWTIMTDGDSGKFNGYEYVFDDPGDHEYSTWSGLGDILTAGERAKWKSQWSGYNKVYYNPKIEYKPWPSTDNYTFNNANTTRPLSDPAITGGTPTTGLNMSDTYVSLGSSPSLTVRNSHYYVLDDTDGDGEYDSGENVYLVNMNGTDRDYYRVTISDTSKDGAVTATTSVTASSVPDSVKAVKYDDEGVATLLTDAEDLQNFANWYQYYRRRELAQKASVAGIIDSVKGVKIGFYGINETGGDKDYQIRQKVLPVYLNEDGVLKDERNTLLDLLYKNDSNKSTPLRKALKAVGEYFKDGGNLDSSGGTPFYPEDKGGACQLAFAVVVTDGFWNGGSPGVGDADDGEGSPYEDANSTPEDGNTLADVAMYYYKGDMQSGLTDKVPPGGCDNNNAQHMVTYTISFGLEGSLPLVKSGDWDYLNDQCLTECTTCPPWPTPKENENTTIDDLWHAAVNGRGAYYSASNTPELIEAMKAIFNNIDDRTSSGSAVSVDGYNVEDDVTLYQAKFDTTDWTGDVLAFEIDNDGDVAEDPKWSAALKLQEMDLNDRKIITYDPGTKQAIPFKFDRLTTDQKAALGVDDTEQKKVIDYLRGNEVDGFRQRKQRLGDIIHSSPVLALDDPMDMVGSSALYAGGNDGMLHVINASDSVADNEGKERWAYIPNHVFENLKELTKPNYQHHFFVDNTPTIESFLIDKGLATEKWMTMLVGGLGKGGKGFYALDLTGVNFTDEDTLSGSDGVGMWEFPNTPNTDDDMGYTYSQPYIVPSNIGDPDELDDVTNWIIIFGNGYQSVNGHAVLYILNPDGTELKKIDTGYGDPADPNGLSSPVVIDVDADGIADYVYAGDWKGNMWKFDLTGDTATKWESAYYNGINPAPLFTAKDPDGNRQPITAKPDVMFHPVEEGYLVFFGTGKLLGGTDAKKVNDIEDFSLQTMYGIWDYGDDSDNDEYLGSFNRSSANKLSNQSTTVSLLEQTEIMWGLPPLPVITNIRYISCNDIEWDVVADLDKKPPPNASEDENPNPAKHAGWYFDLQHNFDGDDQWPGVAVSPPIRRGERVIIEPMVRDSFLIFITYTPEPNVTCAAGGFSIFHEVIAESGAGCYTVPRFDITGDGEPNLLDRVDEKPPQGKKMKGLIHRPKIIEDKKKKREIKLFSSSDEANIVSLGEQAEKRGISYWMEF